jgi:chromosome segregation and condensation protein ScpB
LDYEIPESQPGFTKSPVVALVSLVQPILKSDIKEVHGVLRPEVLGAMMAILARNLALAAQRA